MKLHVILVPDDAKDTTDKRALAAVCSIEGEEFVPSQVPLLIDLQLRNALYGLIDQAKARKEEEARKKDEEAKKKDEAGAKARA